MEHNDEVAAARTAGEDEGKHLSSTAGDCPYDVDRMPLRNAWLDGFSAGRISLSATQPDASFRQVESPEARADRPPVVQGR